MKLVVLGSGTSVPHPDRAAAAFWLETENGSLLLDCSADAPHHMAAEHVDWPNLDAIWISHLHLDHCGGLAPLLFGLKWAPQTQSREKPLKIFGCKDVERVLKAIDDANDYRLFKQPFPIEIYEPGEAEAFAVLKNTEAITFSTPHTRESLALRLTDGRHTLVYSSDTGYAEDLAAFARGADLLILECSFQRNKPTHKHLELDEAMRLAGMAEPRKLLLTHLYPEWDGVDIEARARELWSGETIAARDGLRLEIKD
ncbi:MAG TPA: MBL fold metallo-hydrolase [Pyrinomonadaceae bacterium]|nr:MBL fold metallo-hydrolase [Pyrinomonadaceae bacterium]